MKNGVQHKAARAVDREDIARIFLKPVAQRHRFLLWLGNVLLRPLPLLFGPSASSESGEIKRILIFDSGALGDMILLLPFLQRLSSYFPTSRLTLLARRESGDFLLERGLIHDSIPVGMPWARRLSRWRRHNPFSLAWVRFLRDVLRLRREKFDMAFATGWCGDLRGNFVVWLTGARRRVGYGYAGGAAFLTDVVEPDWTRPHVVDRNMRLLEHLGIPTAGGAESLPVLPDDDAFAAQLLTRHGLGGEDLIIAIHPGAGSAIREWGDERFADVAKAVIDRFGAKVLWFVDPRRPRPMPSGLEAISLSLSLGQLAAILSRCRLFICNDSGPMHIAATLKVPVVAVFGPQRPEWFGPYGEDHRIVIRHDIWCRPCGDDCRWREPHCLRLIPVDQVLDAVTEVIKNLAPACRTVEAQK